MSEGIPLPRTSPENQGSVLNGRMQHWQSVLDGLSAAERADCVELRSEITFELDELWPHHEVVCAYRGWGIRVRYDGEGLPEEEKDYFEGVEPSYGFEIVKAGIGDDYGWHVGYAFMTPRPGTSGKYADNVTFLYASGADVSPIGSEGELFLPVLQKELEPHLHQILSEKSDEAAELLSQPEFFSLSVTDQQKLISKVLREANAVADEYGGITNRPITGSAERGYMHIRDSQSCLGLREVDLSSLVISGECLGLYVLGLERIELLGDPVRCAEDWVDSASGLCLAIQLSSQTKEDIGLENTMLYMPISGQNLDIIFGSLADFQERLH